MENMHIDIGGKGVHLPRKHIQLKNCFLTILKQELQNDARMIFLKYIWISWFGIYKISLPFADLHESKGSLSVSATTYLPLP